MTHLGVYLLLDGTCRQAMTFYQSCFGGSLSITTVGESALRAQTPSAMHARVLHAHLKASSMELNASDWLRPAESPVRGNQVCLYVSGGSVEELKEYFRRLSEGGEITDPLQRTFFGTYGALNDAFGVRWMFQTSGH